MRNLLLITLTTFLFISCDNQVEDDELVRKTVKSKPKTETVVEATTINDGAILVFSANGGWKVSTNEGAYGDEHSTYELYYTKNTNTYEWKLSGFQPKNHSVYKNTISKLIININNANLNGDTYSEIKRNYIDKIVITND